MDAGSCFNTNANRGKDPPTKLANKIVINIVKETRIAIPHPTFGIKFVSSVAIFTTSCADSQRAS